MQTQTSILTAELGFPELETMCRFLKWWHTHSWEYEWRVWGYAAFDQILTSWDGKKHPIQENQSPVGLSIVFKISDAEQKFKDHPMWTRSVEKHGLRVCRGPLTFWRLEFTFIIIFVSNWNQKITISADTSASGETPVSQTDALHSYSETLIPKQGYNHPRRRVDGLYSSSTHLEKLKLQFLKKILSCNTWKLCCAEKKCCIWERVTLASKQRCLKS